MKKWETVNKLKTQKSNVKTNDILQILLMNRGLKTKKDIHDFLNPPDPYSFTSKDVGIDKKVLIKALKRIDEAIQNKESVVVYTDYDADGITAGAIMWETLHKLGCNVMPYTPHRVEEGYGMSIKGIDKVKELYDPKLIITVDHGITAWEKIKYAKKQGIETIVTDHHVKPKKLPACTIVHTTKLCGAGVAWFVIKELLKRKEVILGRSEATTPGSADSGQARMTDKFEDELLALAAIGTIADMVPLTDANRSIAKHGLIALNKTQRVGLEELIKDAGLVKGSLGTYEVSHMLAPRLNAMGRLVHGLDALRLLCTSKPEKAKELAEKLGLTNRERQQLTIDTVLHAKEYLALSVKRKALSKLLFVSNQEYNQGVIGLVAGKLVEEFYRPAIVVTQGEVYSKASARSITGFNIIEAIRSCSDILVDAGGHPMAAGFTVETVKLELLRKRLEEVADKELDEEKLTRKLKIDLEIPLSMISDDLWQETRVFEPFGIGNPEPVFATRGVEIVDIRLVGKEGRHIKLKIKDQRSKIKNNIEAIGFGMGEWYGKIREGQTIDIAYTIDMNVWNGNKSLQLKLRDINGVNQTNGRGSN